jgi:hypothetical protein
LWDIFGNITDFFNLNKGTGHFQMFFYLWITLRLYHLEKRLSTKNMGHIWNPWVLRIWWKQLNLDSIFICFKMTRMCWNKLCTKI